MLFFMDSVARLHNRTFGELPSASGVFLALSSTADEPEFMQRLGVENPRIHRLLN